MLDVTNISAYPTIKPTHIGTAGKRYHIFDNRETLTFFDLCSLRSFDSKSSRGMTKQFGADKLGQAGKSFLHHLSGPHH